MKRYEKILNFEKKLRAEYKNEFVEESALANELFDIFLEANDLILQHWHLQPERRVTMELINRIFNDLHAGLKLALEGMSVQGVALLRDTIECANYIKLFEVDSVYRDKWCQGKDFFLRDIRKRMKELDISPPPQDMLYKSLSRTFLHPSKRGVAFHTVDWYPVVGEHRVLFLSGGVKNIPHTRLTIQYALLIIYSTVWFIWVQMYPVDKDVYPEWYKRLDKAEKSIYSLQVKVNQEQAKYWGEQLATINKILNDYLDKLGVWSV